MADPAPSEAEPVTPPVVTLDDFQAVDFQAAIAAIRHAECSLLSRKFGEAAHLAQGEGNVRAVRVFDLLNSICGFHFKVEDRAGPFGPMMVMNGKRSAIPDDFRGEQSRVLRALMPEISHPGLRARIADTVWLNDRKAHDAAEAAIAAYCETAEALLNGTLKDQFDNTMTASFELLNLTQRALQIAAATRKRGDLPPRASQTAQRLYDRAKDTGECVPFSRIVRLFLQYELGDPIALARDAEAVAQAAVTASAPYPIAIKCAWDCAAYAYERGGDADASRRCLLQGIAQTIAMRGHVSSASAEAHWLRTAIAELRQITDTRDQREALRLEMRALQEKSVDEVGSFQIPLDLGDLRSGTIEIFAGLTLPTALAQFALLSRSQDVETLKSQAMKGAENSPLVSMMGGVHFDAEGKITAETPGASTTGEPSEEWFKKTIAQNLSLHRHVVVGGRIDPARQAVSSNYPVSERHFLPIVTLSPFVPVGHRHIFALGFARFMQGDFISAAHLLVPQLENSVRYVLHSMSRDSSKIMPDMLQEDRPLSALIDQLRSDMERIFSAPIVYEMELLFTYGGGPALRHDFAHGKATEAYCFTPDVLYACWFIYHLTCVPLLGIWASQVGPLIEAECF
ncbi:hypothetical protein SAMN05519103_03233 [Rhizobiales bacterium GAS113]|nr:hypothetical protein SAMN05519103_03233 [Rhizobiales bacterium GAS113]